MKKIISIAFAAILAGLAISCQKEEVVSDKTDAVQYTFNIIVNEQVGFDNDTATKGSTSESHKTTWENGDKIFLFFKPTGGSLLDDRYATLKYNGSSWDGEVSNGQSNLGTGGTLSAVYVYKLGGDVAPVFNTGKWTIATGNTFYNCQTGVTYTVSGDVISATLNLVAPTNFVQFYVTSATGALTSSAGLQMPIITIGAFIQRHHPPKIILQVVSKIGEKPIVLRKEYRQTTPGAHFPQRSGSICSTTGVTRVMFVRTNINLALKYAVKRIVQFCFLIIGNGIKMASELVGRPEAIPRQQPMAIL